MHTLRSKDPKPNSLDEAIERLISEMAGYDASSDEYAAAAKALRTMYEVKALEPKRNIVSAETWAIIGANLAGIGMILYFEKANVLTSKAISLILRPKM